MGNSKFFNKGISTPLGILIIVLCALLAGGILAWQYLEISKEIKAPEVEISEKVIPEEVVEEETANWKTYRNEEYGFEVKYPSDWKIVLQDEQSARIYTDDHIISEEECKQEEADLIRKGVDFGPTGCRFGIFVSSITKQELEKQYDVISQYQSSLPNSYQVFQLNRDYLPPDFAIALSSETNKNQFIMFEAYNIKVGRQDIDAEIFLNQMISTFRFLN